MGHVRRTLRGASCLYPGPASSPSAVLLCPPKGPPQHSNRANMAAMLGRSLLEPGVLHTLRYDCWPNDNHGEAFLLHCRLQLDGGCLWRPQAITRHVCYCLRNGNRWSCGVSRALQIFSFCTMSHVCLARVGQPLTAAGLQVLKGRSGDMCGAKANCRGPTHRTGYHRIP